MAVRDFTDERGERWRAWDVVPTSIVPATKSEDYLAGMYQTGWVVFETVSGDQKRRLSEVPQRWAEASVADLRAMLARADAVPGRQVDAERQAVGEPTAAPLPRVDVPAADRKPDVTDLHVARTFRYPGGRFWTVCVNTYMEDGAPPVLRFNSGTRNIDLRVWPGDWADYPDERLVELLRRGAPRFDTEPPPPGSPRRRWSDRPAPSP